MRVRRQTLVHAYCVPTAADNRGHSGLLPTTQPIRRKCRPPGISPDSGTFHFSLFQIPKLRTRVRFPSPALEFRGVKYQLRGLSEPFCDSAVEFTPPVVLDRTNAALVGRRPPPRRRNRATLPRSRVDRSDLRFAIRRTHRPRPLRVESAAARPASTKAPAKADPTRRPRSVMTS
jgi:hypothetical protein